MDIGERFAKLNQIKKEITNQSTELLNGYTGHRNISKELDKLSAEIAEVMQAMKDEVQK